MFKNLHFVISSRAHQIKRGKIRNIDFSALHSKQSNPVGLLKTPTVPFGVVLQENQSCLQKQTNKQETGINKQKTLVQPNDGSLFVILTTTIAPKRNNNEKHKREV